MKLWLWFYSVGILCFGQAVKRVGLWNKKAKLRSIGQYSLHKALQSAIESKRWDANAPSVWFHCSSLGEFEQGRSVIEAYRKLHPHQQILLTFFSSSGYEIRKHYDKVTLVGYLPIDTTFAIEALLNLISLEKVFWVKSEFWWNIILTIQKRKIPIFLIAARVDAKNLYLKWPIRPHFHKLLSGFTAVYCIDAFTENICRKAGQQNVYCVGDPRIDRVYDLTVQAPSFPLIKEWLGTDCLFIAGSTWQNDEHLFWENAPLWMQMKILIVPHEVEPNNIQRVLKSSPLPAISYSDLEKRPSERPRILVFDRIGSLGYLYQYATMVYIGGGFHGRLHSVFEPAVWKAPVFIGPKHRNSEEAMQLVQLGGISSVSNANDLREEMAKLNDKNTYAHKVQIINSYLEKNRGATNSIIKGIS